MGKTKKKKLVNVISVFIDWINYRFCCVPFILSTSLSLLKLNCFDFVAIGMFYGYSSQIHLLHRNFVDGRMCLNKTFAKIFILSYFYLPVLLSICKNVCTFLYQHIFFFRIWISINSTFFLHNNPLSLLISLLLLFSLFIFYDLF